MTAATGTPIRAVTPAPADRRGHHLTRGHRCLPSLLPGLLMAVIGLAGATRPVLSWDEIATADVASRSVGQIWQLVQHIDGVFGPYYLAMHCWTSLFGDSVLDLRLPSILAMSAAVAASGELGRRLFGARAGIVGGLLLCLIPNLSRYAAEARPYAFACMFATLSLVVLYQVVVDGPTVGRWVAYGALLLGTGLSHIVALTTIVAHAAILAVHRRPPRIWLQWLVSMASA